MEVQWLNEKKIQFKLDNISPLHNRYEINNVPVRQ